MFISEKWKNCTEDGDGVQYRPPPNIAPWHNEYLELKESEKQQVPGRFSNLPMKLVIRPSCEMCPSYTQRKGAVLSPWTEGLQKESA